MKTPSLRLGLLLAANLGLIPSALFSQDIAESLTEEGTVQRANQEQVLGVQRAAGPVKIDGILNEGAWSNALSFILPYEKWPADNSPAPVRTECLITFSDTRILVAFRAYDPTPETLRARFSERDRFPEDENVTIKLDTFNDGRRAFWFMVNPLGVQADGVVDDLNGSDDRWDGIWESAASRTPFGYVVELGIPFSTLRFAREVRTGTWGIEATRYFVDSSGHVLSSIRLDRDNASLISQFSKIQGFETGGRRVPLSIHPTFSTFSTNDTQRGEGHGWYGETRLGGEIEFTPSPAANGSLTVRPDFSQVEPDAFLVDLNSPHALKFEEKRPFFLEASDALRLPLELVYTRSIADPLWGMRGYAGGAWGSLSGFAARDRTTRLIRPGVSQSSIRILDEPSTALILRGRSNLNGDLTMGGVFTAREGDEWWSRVSGVDGDLRISESDRLEFLFALSDARIPDEPSAEGRPESVDQRDWAGTIGITHEGRAWDGALALTTVRPDFRADLGFLPKGDYQSVDVSGSRTWYLPPDGFLTQVVLGVTGDMTDGFSEGYRSHGFAIEGTAHGTHRIQLDLGFETSGERLRQSSVRSSGMRVGIRAVPRTEIALDVRAYVGELLDYLHARVGKGFSSESRLDMSVGRRVQLNTSFSWEELHLPRGRMYRAGIWRGTGLFHFSRRAYLRATIQRSVYIRNPWLYEMPVPSRSRLLEGQVLLSLRMTPRIYGYLGGTFTADDQDSLQADRNKGVFLRLGYSWNVTGDMFQP